MAGRIRTDEEILLICNEEFKATAGIRKSELYHKVTKSRAKILPVFSLLFSLNAEVI